jgi:hypothetical protein
LDVPSYDQMPHRRKRHLYIERSDEVELGNIRSRKLLEERLAVLMLNLLKGTHFSAFRIVRLRSELESSEGERSGLFRREKRGRVSV